MTQLPDVLVFIGSLQIVETQSYGARVLRNHLSISSDLAFVSSEIRLTSSRGRTLLKHASYLRFGHRQPCRGSGSVPRLLDGVV